MKIGILTQPLKSNYGGILQNFALQLTLKRMGHDVWTINRERNNSYFKRFLSLSKRILFLRTPFRAWTTKKEDEILYKNLIDFIKSKITLTERFSDFSVMKRLKDSYNFDAYIVGSDQCWRPKYNDNNASFFFLDFLEQDEVAKRISFSSSFGIDSWPLSSSQTVVCANLAKRFNAISVREDSAVTLCKNYLGVEATHVLDPTFLLSKEDYKEIFSTIDNNREKLKGQLVSYILDDSENSLKICQKTQNELNVPLVSLHKRYLFQRGKKSLINDFELMPVEDWLANFYEADYIVTDSFHGTVFSIIFNKQFISIGNRERGMARFNSLLKIFGLEDRLVFSELDVTEKLIKEKINYTKINEIIEKERSKSFDFLIAALQ